MGVDLTKLIEKLDPRRDGPDSLKPRTAVVNAVNVNGTLDIILSGVVIPNVPRLSSVGVLVGDTVQVTTSRGGLLVIGVVATTGLPQLASENGVSAKAVTSGTNTTTSATYVDMAGTGSSTSFSFTKRYTGSRIRVDVSASMYVPANVSNVVVGVRINGTDYDLYEIPVLVNTRAFGVAFRYITGVASGVYTVQARWRRSSGTGTLTRDTADWLSVSAREST